MTTQTTHRVLDLSPIQGSNIKEPVEIPDGLTLLEQGQEAPPEFGIFRILNPKSGDDRLTWDRRDFRAMQDARSTFLDFVKRGFKPFRVGSNGQRSNEVMQEFDPTAQQVVFVPMAPVAGG